MKMTKISFLLMFFSVSIFVLNSCAPAYTPNAVNIPLLTNKKEIQISGSTGLSGVEAQLAVGVTNHIGVMVNWNYRDDTNDTTDTYHYHNFFEGGIGYYTTFSSLGRFEIYGGYGFGNVDVNIQTIATQDIVKAKFNRVFIQPNFGFSSQFFDLGFAPRIVYVMMNPERLQYSTINRFFVEPAGILRFGYRYMYLTSQIGFSIPLNGFESSTWFNTNPFLFSVGINIKLFKIYDSQARYSSL